MAEAMALGVLQIVVPVALAALPAIWKQIAIVLKRIPTMTKDSINNTNLVCIKTILDTLEQVPNLEIQLSHNQLLLNKIKLKAEALEKALSRKTFQLRKALGLPKHRIVQDINEIVMMMQILDSNIRVHQHPKKPKEYTANGRVEAYQRKLENLEKDLLNKLDEDDLAPVIVNTSADFWAFMKKSSTYPKIYYHFDHQSPEAVYPKTLTVSRGVRECIELLLKWLRDLEGINEGQDSSLVVGVAFFVLFTETLPYVLEKHLTCSRRITKNLQNAKQFHANLCFWRSFSRSEAFMRFQGGDGLQLEKEDMAKLDLRDALWKTWEDVQKKIEEIISGIQGTSEFLECRNCHISLKADSTTRALLEAHKSKCLAKNSNSCFTCGLDIDHLSSDDRALHVNNCVDEHAI